MVVEDDYLAREMLVRALTAAGFDVTWAADGDEAVSRITASEQAFDLLCSDAVFPGKPLDEVISQFKAQSPSAPILICSGYVPEELGIESLQDIEYDFLPKPFPPSKLIGAIDSALTCQKA